MNPFLRGGREKYAVGIFLEYLERCDVYIDWIDPKN